MMNISVNEQYSYIEIEVYGQYQSDRFGEVFEIMRGLAERHGYFSELEVHHGKVDNIFSAIKQAGNSSTDYSFMNKLRKYALVSDNPGFFLRLVMLLSRFGKFDMRIFPMHERDRARQWIEESSPQPLDQAVP